MIDIKRIKPGLSVMAADKTNNLLLASTIVVVDPVTKEIGVRYEISGESQLASAENLYLSYRKNGGGFQQPSIPPQNEQVTDFEAYIVAISKGKINRTSLDELAAKIKERGPVEETWTQNLLKYYR